MALRVKYRFLLLDADGTLFDFLRCEHDALIDALADFGVTADEEMVKSYSRINDSLWKMLERGEIRKNVLREERFRRFAVEYGFSLDIPALSAAYTDHLSAKNFLVPGALPVCRTLAGKYKLYIVTNGLKTVQERRLDASPLCPFFSGRFISEEMGAEKPSPAFFAAVDARIPDFSPEKALIIGDSLSSDMKGGVAAGIDTCWYNPAGLPAPKDMNITYTIGRLEELLPLLGL